VEAETAGAAVAEAFDEGALSEVELATAAAEAWLRKGGAVEGAEPWETRRRLYAYLARRGFDSDTIRQVSGAVLGRD
jgi:SOS response regulatory protein OraA/RecX